MLHLLILIPITFVTFILSSTLIFCGAKKHKVDGKTASMSDDPPSKKCNTKGGLLADDPDLKSLKLKAAKEQQKGGNQLSTMTPTSKKPSTQEGTDLKSFDDKGKKKEHLRTAVTALDQKAMSAYANNKTGANQDGVSMLAMAKVDKEKLPVKMAPKQPEVVAQDSTQADDSAKNSKSKSKSHTGKISSSKKTKSQHGAEGKKKKNLEDLLDAMMDKTQTTADDDEVGTVTGGTATTPTPTKDKQAAAAETKPEGKPQTKIGESNPTAVAPKTKLAEVKTQVPTKIMDVESVSSEKNKKGKQKATDKDKEEKRSADAIKKAKPPSKRC